MSAAAMSATTADVVGMICDTLDGAFAASARLAARFPASSGGRGPLLPVRSSASSPTAPRHDLRYADRRDKTRG